MRIRILEKDIPVFSKPDGASLHAKRRHEKRCTGNMNMENRVNRFPRWIMGFVLLGVCAAPGLLIPVLTLFAQERVGLGLVLAKPEQLRGIPLAFTPYAGEALPASVDLSRDMPPPGNQGSQNSCVGWSVAYAIKSYAEKIEEGLPYFQNGQVDLSRIFSPSYIFNQLNQGRNVPIPFFDALNLLSEQGVASLADMPYTAEDFVSQPSAGARAAARRYRIDYWRQVNIQDLKELKAHLHAGYPILIGANVDEAFLHQPAGTTWSTIGKIIGGHAMVVCGYDDSHKAFRLINSWGTQWCDAGFCWVDYDHFRRVVNEGYVVKDAKNGPPSTRTSSLVLTNVLYDAAFPGRADLGYFMKFDGTLDIPAGTGRSDQVVVYFYLDAGNGTKGQPIQSLDAQYADTNGFAACGTAAYPVPTEGLQTTWQCWIPYKAFALSAGQWVQTATGPQYQFAHTSCVAEAVLFIDNFGTVRSPLLPFIVKK